MTSDPTSLARPLPILYVDDEEGNRVVFEAAFGNEFEIVCAASGAEALAELASRQFDVLLTDQRMPGMTGIELCEQVRERYPEMQRLIVSAYTERESVLKAINQGRVSGFLTKPWSPSDLRRALLDAQSLAHRTRLAGEIVAAMQIRSQAEAQRQLLHDLANVASRVVGCCDELQSLYPTVAAQVEANVAKRLSEELVDLRQSVGFLTDLHTSVRGLHIPDDPGHCGIVELHHLLHGALAVARGQLPPGITIDVRCPSDLVVRGDRTDLGRVLVNLIVNAGHAMAEAAVEEPRLVLAASNDHERVRLTVSDNGPGVPTALQDRVFEARFTTRRGAGGSGLGLAISRRLVEDNGGSIALAASSEGGATFELWLPAGEPAPV